MLPEIANRVEFLKNVLIFNELDEDDLAEIADRLTYHQVGAGEVIFREGQPADNMYIILSGQVQVSRFDPQEEREYVVAVFDAEDTFGEESLLLQKPRTVTVLALEDTELYCLSAEDFEWLRKTYPQVKPYLNAFSQTYKIANKLNIDWLGEGETISLITRRHPIKLIEELAVVILIILIPLTLLAGLLVLLKDKGTITYLGMACGGGISLLGLMVLTWSYAEWLNDFFIITNVRVVWRERYLLRGGSRREVPLRAIQSISIQTGSFIERLLKTGDVVVRTFNTKLHMTDVNNPQRMKDMIDAFLRRARKKSIREEQRLIRRTIRQRLGLPIEEEKPKIPEHVPPAIDPRPQRLSLFRTRVVDGEIITYRKHWWLFFKRAWRPVVCFTLGLAAGVWMAPQVFLGSLNSSYLTTFVLLEFIFLIWLAYEYEDWRNDIYRVTSDQIIDRDKKPFGKERLDAAPIQNIQSVGHEIPGTLGLILNVGNVTIDVGDKTLTFEGVHNPALVQQDIFRKMEAHHAQTEKERIQAEHQRLATWFEIYYKERPPSNTELEEDTPDFH